MIPMPSLPTWRHRVIGLACALSLSACGGAAGASAGGDGSPGAATAAGNDSYARRAAARLEVEALPGAGGGPFEGREHPSDVLAYTADHRAHVTYPFGTPPSAYMRDLPELMSAGWTT